MKTLKFSTYIVLMLIALFSCEDQLDLAPISTTGENGFFNNADEIELGVFGIYEAMGDVVEVEYLFTEFRSDNAGVANLEGDMIIINTLTESAELGVVGTYWAAQYNVIARANKVLKYIDNVSDATEKKELEAEIRFLRAFAHFSLVRLFGPVPLIDREITYNDTDMFAKDDESTIYSFIEQELTYAIANLPASYSSGYAGRATNVAAKAVMAQVLVAQGKGASALTYLNDVIGNHDFSSVSFADLFLDANETNDEIVFSLRFASGVSAGQEFSNEFSNAGFYAGINLMEDNLYNLYEAGDARLAVSVSADEFRYLMKFAENTTDDSGDDWIYIRKAEQLLLRAEINATADAGISQSAIDDINKLRTRAGVAEFTATDFASKAELLTAIENERRKELFGEGYRMYDLLRKGKAEAAAIMSAHTGTAIPESQIWLPIPQAEIDASGGMLTQNR